MLRLDIKLHLLNIQFAKSQLKRSPQKGVTLGKSLVNCHGKNKVW